MPHGLHHELRNHPLVFVDDLNQPVLSQDDARHVTKSLRLRSGAKLAVGDGDGRWRWVRLAADAQLETVDDSIYVEPAPEARLTLGFAPVKGDRSDLIVQKATELGIGRIVPVHTVRSVVRWDAERAAKHLARHKRIAREAAMQARRVHLPDVLLMVALADLAVDLPSMVLAEPGGPPLSTVEPAPMCVVIGPEGGFDAAELARHSTVGLPGHILRSETAAIVGAAAMRARFELDTG